MTSQERCHLSDMDRNMERNVSVLMLFLFFAVISSDLSLRIGIIESKHKHSF